MQHSTKRSSGAGAGALLVVLALVLLIGPMFTTALSGMAQMVSMGFGVAMLIVGAVILTVTRLYQKASANESFVRTGMGGQRVIIDGGALVIPVVHELIPVSLETMRLDVTRQGEDALITGDNLRADVAAEFYIKVQKAAEDVKAAATSLGGRSVEPSSVKELVFQKLVSALRTVAATMPLNELHTKRDEFAAAVQQIVTNDLQSNGLTLESVTISGLDQTPPDSMRAESNVFDAQGLRAISAITNAQRVERTRIEAEADREVKLQEVERDKYLYQQEVQRASAEAEKQAQIQKAQAEQQQEADTISAEQRRLAEVAKAESQRAIEVAEVERQKAVDVAEQQRQQAVRQAEIARQRVVELDEEEQKIAVAGKMKQRAEAEQERYEAQQKEEQAKQEVMTVEATQRAEREKEVAVIAEQAEIQKQRLKKEMEVNVGAYETTKTSEAERTAAENEKAAKELKAAGDRAVEMVPVEVDREKVEVERARVEVERQELEAKDAHERIAIDLQVQLAKIAADKEVGVEAAKSFGQAMAAAKITLWGDPAAVASMSQSFFSGQRKGLFVEGLAAGTPPEVKEAARKAAEGIGSGLGSVVENLTGVKLPAEKLAALDELLSKPKKAD